VPWSKSFAAEESELLASAPVRNAALAGQDATWSAECRLRSGASSAFTLLSQHDHFPNLKTNTIFPSETSVRFYQSARCYIQEFNTLYCVMIISGLWPLNANTLQVS
jgi:hypothetical protein